MAAKNTCDPVRMSIERFSARTFVILGGAFWTIAAFAGPYSFKGVDLPAALTSAMLPLAITAVALAVGWFFERVAAGGLVAGAVAVGVWGIVAAWEANVWLIMATVLIAPMLIAAVLFYLAASMQTVCSIEGGGDQLPHGSASA